MAYTAIAKSSDHFDCPTWTGSDSTTTITGMSFKPDILWIKNYSGSGHPVFNDSSKGIGFNWIPSGNNANDTTNYVASYTSDGFTLTGNLANSNDASDSYVGACWKANSGTTSSNSDGSITSTVQANTTSGVSVVTYTGTGSAGTIGHGLGVAPKLIMVKNTTQSDRGKMLCMGTTFVADPQTDSTEFAYTGAQADNTAFNDTAPTTTKTFSTNCHLALPCYWYIPDNIIVDAVHWWAAADAATGDDFVGHLMSYSVSTSGTGSGNLSSGVIVANGATLTSAGYEDMQYQSMTVQNEDVDAGKVVLFTFASDTINSDYTINATVKYHVR